MFTFTLNELGQNTNTIEYEPNIPGLSKVGLNYDGFGAAISLRNSAKELNTQKGHSQFIDVQLNYHNTIWGIDLYYQKYSGFFIKNSNQLGQNNGSFFLLPDLNYAHHGIMGRYSLTKSDFSLSGLMNQSDNVKETSGQYFVAGGIQQYRLDSDQTIVPTSLLGRNEDMDKLRELRTISLNLGLGAGKYWVSDSHYFIGTLLDVIGTLGLYDYKLTDKTLHSSYATISYNLKVGLGYAGESWKYGLSFYNDVTTVKGLNHSYLKPLAGSLLLYLRYSFK